MSWRPAGRQSGLPLVRFLEQDEWRHVALSDRIRRSGAQPRFGQIDDGRLWIYETNRGVDGALFLSRYGVVLPAYGPSASTGIDAAFLRRILVLRRDRIFSLIGTEDRVRSIEALLGETPPDAECYRVFTGGDAPLRPAQKLPDLGVHRAGPEHLNLLWPLEKAYQLEEVLRPNSVLNERSGRRHFLETLKNQVVYYAVLNGRAVAKAGTNARGWGWDQIGGVFVIPEFRGCGFAREVMTRLLEEIREAGKQPCLFVKTSNIAARSLYDRLQFTDRGPFRITYWSR